MCRRRSGAARHRIRYILAKLAAKRAIRGDQALPLVSIAGLWIMTGVLGLGFARVDLVDLVDLRLGAMSG
jgi:hypothetical protein